MNKTKPVVLITCGADTVLVNDGPFTYQVWDNRCIGYLSIKHVIKRTKFRQKIGKK